MFIFMEMVHKKQLDGITSLSKDSAKLFPEKVKIPKLFPKRPRIDDLQVYTSQFLEVAAPLHCYSAAHLHSRPTISGSQHGNSSP